MMLNKKSGYYYSFSEPKKLIKEQPLSNACTSRQETMAKLYTLFEVFLGFHIKEPFFHAFCAFLRS